MSKIKNSEFGQSMIEMLGVLAIIGVLSVGGIAGYSKAMMKYKINKTINQISMIAANIQAFFGHQKDFSGLNNEVIKKAHLAPDEMWQGSDIIDTYGNTVTVIPNEKAFSINLTSVEQDICIELTTKDWGISASAVSIGTVEDIYTAIANEEPGINSTNAAAWYNVGYRCIKGFYGSNFALGCRKDKTLPLTISAANSACGAQNSVSFYFGN